MTTTVNQPPHAAALYGIPAAAPHKNLPTDVTAPLNQLLGWALWLCLAICLAWLILSAGRLWAARSAPGQAFPDAVYTLLMSLAGALLCSTASAIALAVLS